MEVLEPTEPTAPHESESKKSKVEPVLNPSPPALPEGGPAQPSDRVSAPKLIGGMTRRQAWSSVWRVLVV